MDLYDIFQNFRISDVSKEAGAAKSNPQVNETTLRGLQDQIDHLSVVCFAMGELLDDVGLNKQMLASKIEDMDPRDGKKDGKYIPAIICPSCERKLAPRHVSCMYCGCKIERSGL